jgi:hypothetical protein
LMSERTATSVGSISPVIELAASGVHAGDIEKNARFQLLLVKAVLHEVTDTNDALQLIVLYNRQVTNSCDRHCRERGIHAIGGATGADGRRHQLLDRKAQHGAAASGNRVDEIPLREYADRLHPPILYDQGADAMLGQLADRKFDAVRKADPHYVMALGL